MGSLPTRPRLAPLASRGGRGLQHAPNANEAPPSIPCGPGLGRHVATSRDGQGVIRLLPGMTSRLSRERSVLPLGGVKGRR